MQSSEVKIQGSNVPIASSHESVIWRGSDWIPAGKMRAYFDLCLIFLLLRFSLLKSRTDGNSETTHFFSSASPNVSNQTNLV